MHLFLPDSFCDPLKGLDPWATYWTVFKVVKSSSYPQQYPHFDFSRWISEEWEHCTKTCGTLGFQIRTVRCVQFLHDGTNRSVHSKYCSGEKPESRRPCNRVPCPAQWRTGAWSEVQHLHDLFEREIFFINSVLGSGCLIDLTHHVILFPINTCWLNRCQLTIFPVNTYRYNSNFNMPDILDKAVYEDRARDIQYLIWSSVASHPKTAVSVEQFPASQWDFWNPLEKKSNRSDSKLSSGEQIRANKMQILHVSSSFVILGQIFRQHGLESSLLNVWALEHDSSSL